MTRVELIDLLIKNNQEHLLQYYDVLPIEGKDKLAEQIEKIDWKLIELAKKGNQHQNRGFFEPLAGMSIERRNENKHIYEELGQKAIQEGKVAAVLLAGGQGTRLGCEGPKGTVNIGITKELYIFEMLFKNTMEVTNKAKKWIPFYIMTSIINHEQTITFLKEHNYFGYPEEYIIFYIQDMALSVDYEGKLYMESSDQLSMSPNGNGGWFSSMVNAGLLEGLQNNGVEWINVFSVDNVLQRIADPVFIGATIASNSFSGAKAVRKVDPNERVGVLCLEDGKPSIVEYYEMTDEMVRSRNQDGELSYAFGVILNYLFRVDKLIEILNKSLPIHVVEKKIPNYTLDGQYIKPDKPNGYKFELLILDMIHMFENCLPYEVVREDEFAPIKNATGVDSLESARRLLIRKGYRL